ncbi:hypothetical protein AX15_005896 [Amanita polypyramis BW_CC]|nr:hypothetical protein AX15_005896 [Amanita polypyramis BW_CC]
MDPVTGTSTVAAPPVRLNWLFDFFRTALKWLWKWFTQLVGNIKTFTDRIAAAARGSFANLKPTIDYLLQKIVSLTVDWPTEMFEFAAYTVRHYPHLVHLTAWFIFFGPLAVICPLLLLYEAGIAIVFHMSFLFHGLIPGTLEKNYLELREATDDTRQWVFVYVERATNTYNKWTMESNPLLVFRLVAGVIGTYVLYSIWFPW